MKLMKHITIALVLCAIPAMAFGQDVSCESCTHNVSVYMGEGGLVATADGAEKVTWVATCGGVTRSGELEAGEDGMVAALFTMDNGLACASPGEKDKFELGPVMDGGWFWITDDMNSAVGGLVAKDVLMNDTTDITKAGGVETMDGKGAVYLKETATGRVGILPTILAVPHVDPPETDYCDTTGAGTTASPYVKQTTNCMLGDGSTEIAAEGPADPYTGKKADIMDGGMVTRPTTTNTSVEITYTLWSKGGQYVTGNCAGDPCRKGHAGGAPLTATWGATAASGGPQSIDDISTAGLTVGQQAGTLTIEPAPTFCNAAAKPPVNHSVTVTVNASVADTGVMTPPIKQTAGIAATHKITVVCPAASASQGVELVPENPFPVE